MNKASVFLISALTALRCAAASTTVDVIAEGYTYTYESARGVFVKVPIFAAVVNGHDLRVTSGTGSVNASAYLGEGDAEEIVTALRKALEWASKVKELKLEASKDLLATPISPGLRLIFSASQEGAESHVDLKMYDFRSSKALTLRLELQELPKLIEVFQKLPAAFEKYRRQQEKTKQVI